MKSRVEKDGLGEVEVSADAYYGSTTQRVIQDFKISGLHLHPKFLDAYIMLKKACAIANIKTAGLSADLGNAIVRASDEILNGKLRDQFVVDTFQMGAGTSFNMNCNEVIANRANEILGSQKGVYSPVHPNDHVNMSQSTNDTFPTAIRIAILLTARNLSEELHNIENSFRKKGVQFKDIVKSGRTHLQDAVPITLGQEFKAYSKEIQKRRKIFESSVDNCREIGIGGSAVGTGINVPKRYSDEVLDQLAIIVGIKFASAEDLVGAMQSQAVVSDVSGSLRNLALDLNRISNDIRLLSSGPRTGLAEIRLPDFVPGSSIMPGKVNPSILEMLNMVCYQVMGNDLTVALSVQAGQLELNVMMPVMVFNILFSIEILTNSISLTRRKCIDGIDSNDERCRQYSEDSLGLATVLNPIIGYKKTSDIVRQALNENKSIIDIIREERILSGDDIKEIMKPERMTQPSSGDKKVDSED
jgi:aspartate ammonia-lyase